MLISPRVITTPPLLRAPKIFTAISQGTLDIEQDGTHIFLGSWALSNKDFQNGLTSKYHFRIVGNKAADDAKVMLERIKASGLEMDDDRQIKNHTNENGFSQKLLAHSTFPIDLMNYKGSFELLMGSKQTKTRIAHQVVLRFMKNLDLSYNVHGKGLNNFGKFDLTGDTHPTGQQHWSHAALYELSTSAGWSHAAVQVRGRRLGE
jgi:hypothetical protein